MVRTGVMLCGLLGAAGCARIANGPYGAYLDAAGRPSSAAANAARLRVSSGEIVDLSSRNFAALEFTFENPTESWLRVEKVQLDFGGEKNNQAVYIPWGSQLESWAAATNQRNAIRDINRATALEMLSLGGAVISAAAGAHSAGLQAAGGIVSLASAAALLGTDMQTRAETAEHAPTFAGRHLFAVPFDVPPGLFSKRWIVVNTSSDPRVGCMLAVTLTYELADKTSHRVALTFRRGYESQWQREACKLMYASQVPAGR
jgi:hypothetical protein